MAETTPEAPAVETKVAEYAGMGSVGESSTPDPSPSYPYLQILQQLQSTAVRAQDPDHEEKSDESPSSSSWDLSTDALLATLLHEFSSHIALRTHRVSSEIRSLQRAVNDAGVGVALCQTEFMKRSNDFFMEQVVGDDDDDDDESDSDSDDDGCESGNPNAINDGRRAVNVNVNTQKEEQNEDDGDDESDDSSADIARLEAEEKSAISDGMKALNLFFDPKRRRPPKPITNTNSGGGGGGEGGGSSQQTMDLIGTDAEGDIIGENCYYYPSAEGDGFNQRPLPFIVGSREFMESSCAGLGGGGGGNGNGEYERDDD